MSNTIFYQKEFLLTLNYYCYFFLCNYYYCYCYYYYDLNLAIQQLTKLINDKIKIKNNLQENNKVFQDY